MKSNQRGEGRMTMEIIKLSEEQITMNNNGEGH